jgi:hypothetical protein
MGSHLWEEWLHRCHDGSSGLQMISEANYDLGCGIYSQEGCAIKLQSFELKTASPVICRGEELCLKTMLGRLTYRRCSSRPLRHSRLYLKNISVNYQTSVIWFAGIEWNMNLQAVWPITVA